MSDARHEALVTRLAAFDTLVEVGIGERPGTAAALAARGRTVTATDIRNRTVPAGVTFVQDDVTDPDPAVYADTEAVYARNLPPELHRPAFDVARAHDATLLFTTLGGEQPIVPVRRETVGQATLYVAARDRPGADRSD
ncbi:UPF0146 family protein [Halorientalis litorea]|uniref:UPF0146 family protein n=1 Tax=Halorientalis litorea TaxID=2931977 RepID=UPI001FF5D501|nr:UPF0146 family protein [Halorientalis litorea]